MAGWEKPNIINFRSNSTVFMIIDFIIYTTNRCFKGYFYALSVLSILIVVLFTSITKFVIAQIEPAVLQLKSAKAIFQLSIFLFLPLFIYLTIRKYKYPQLLNNELRIKELPLYLCIFSVVVIMVILFSLFAYVLLY